MPTVKTVNPAALHVCFDVDSLNDALVNEARQIHTQGCKLRFADLRKFMHAPGNCTFHSFQLSNGRLQSWLPRLSHDMIFVNNFSLATSTVDQRQHKTFVIFLPEDAECWITSPEGADHSRNASLLAGMPQVPQVVSR